MGITTDQRAEAEARLLDHVKQIGSVRSAGQAVAGAHLKRQIGLRAFHELKHRGQIRQRADGRYVLGENVMQE